MSTDLIAGRYRRARSLGRGAMGEVWLADDLVLGRQVAVKHIRVDNFAEPDAKAFDRIAREARVAAQLQHPNVVAVYDLATEDGQPYLVLEYVAGESLADRIRRVGPIAVDEAARMFAHVAAGLAAAHRVGVVHRDVKPSNILITDTGEIKLADFGIARREDDGTLTNVDSAVGTVAYMAPEVARGNQASAASDMWSLGASLYAALEGHAPHGGTGQMSTATLLVKLVTEPIPPPHRAGRLAAVLARLLDIDPRSRPTADEARRMLSDGTAPDVTVARASLAGIALPSETIIRPSSVNRPRRAILAWAAAAGALLAAVAVVLVVVLTNGGSSPTPVAAGNSGPSDAQSADTGSTPQPPTVSTSPSPTPAVTQPVAVPTPTASPAAPVGPLQRYDVQVQVGPSDDDCISNAYGQVQQFLENAGGCDLTRSLYSARTSGQAVTVSVVIVSLPDPSNAPALVNLATSNGTGDIRTLVESGDGYAGSPGTWTQDPTFYATVDAAGDVEIVEAMWSDENIPTHENNPALTAVIRSIAPDVTG